MNHRVPALLLMLAPAAAWAHAPSMDATATLAEPALPPAKAGGRELQRVFAGSAAEVFRVETEAEWRDLHAFREIVPAGTWVLRVTMTSAHREYEDLRTAGALSSPMKVTLSAHCAWERDGVTVVEAPMTVERATTVKRALTKDDLRAAWRGLFRELGQRAFSLLYESKGREGAGAGPR